MECTMKMCVDYQRIVANDVFIGVFERRYSFRFYLNCYQLIIIIIIIINIIIIIIINIEINIFEVLILMMMLIIMTLL
jgi:hypothetical protein